MESSKFKDFSFTHKTRLAFTLVTTRYDENRTPKRSIVSKEGTQKSVVLWTGLVGRNSEVVTGDTTVGIGFNDLAQNIGSNLTTLRGWPGGWPGSWSFDVRS